MFYPHIKSEASASPDLSPLHHFHFKFAPSHDPQPPSRTPSDPPTPLYRFGSYSTTTTTSPSSQHPPYMSYDDDYDDIPGGYFPSQLSQAAAERTRVINVESQSANANARDPTSHAKAVLCSARRIYSACTFLGPSRKRGPPKGYIDAIEARLHQTEALVGIILASKDQRAQSLLRDIAKDSLAKEIITRVDNSPYGVKGRKRAAESSAAGSKKTAESTAGGAPKEDEDGRLDLTSAHPSNEWQDKVVDMLGAGRTSEPIYYQATPSAARKKPSLRVATYVSDEDAHSGDGRGRQRRRLGEEDYEYDDMGLPSPASTSASLSHSASSRTRDDEAKEEEEEKQLAEAVGELSLNEEEEVRYHGKASGLYLLTGQERVDKRNEGGIWRFPGARVWPPLPSVVESELSDESDGHVAALGTTSKSQLKAHSLANGQIAERSLGLLDSGKGLDGNEPLPTRGEQERLLELYFTYVHPSFPVVHKKAFWDIWRNGGEASPYIKRSRRVAPLLLLAMFALAARYDIPTPEPSSTSFPSPSVDSSSSPTSTTPLPTDGISMWTAGEQYFNSAKILLDTTYASSRPSTCQALLLMGYREIGIGAMALAWTYVGMAIRMAQDLGMHKKAEGWRRPGLGPTKPNEASAATAEEGCIFGDWELGERRRIWFGCVVMDKYVSAYIGRPLMIYERDFDTELPELNESDEMDEWKSLGVDGKWTSPVPGRVVSCFNKCAELSGILSAIIQAIYAVRPFPGAPGTLTSPVARPAGRQAETAKRGAVLEGVLDKWYFDLPEHLRYDCAVTADRDASSLPPAHTLTLHMQYWCAVLLLHRPFIRPALGSKNRSGSDDQTDPDDLELINSRKSYELCASAANHITSIVTAYRERYPLNRCSVFLCYYVFTASIMHVISVNAYPDDPQARINLRRCLDALSAMRHVWPAAERALELFSGAKMNLSIPGVNTAAVTPNNQATQKVDTPNSHKRKSTHEGGVEESVTTPVVNDFLNSAGEYVAPIRSGVTAQVHHSVHRQISQRGLDQAGQYPTVQPQSYQGTSETHAIQPPTLLPPTEYRWSNTSPTATTSGSQAVVEESNVRGNSRHYHQEDELPLSTSVLPQFYSTGLVDDQHQQQHLIAAPPRHGPTHAHTIHPHTHHHHHQYSRSPEVPSQAPSHSQPQYWSDYSTFSQLGQTETGGYNSLGMSVAGITAVDLLQDHPQPQQPQQHLPHPQHTNVPNMYMADSYMYGE
ncbi:hypothetical protein P691DRAFT_792603 [Macrolepiota fuliginosa MF-IS2]|uniref:Xylanolytic transcriptional activator regulatory domain-containing protein n=1 Tax=Macrolepiota fuliginosa MF-IS2 TaxID=1400762 RepID=A0A9P6C4I5_9AGAR|nr:hypothetical protein P691DRAFT_792603 [Macrolepiota fuliginosa MF-IS2]